MHIKQQQKKSLTPMLLEGPEKFIPRDKAEWSENAILFGRPKKKTGNFSFVLIPNPAPSWQLLVSFHLLYVLLLYKQSNAFFGGPCEQKGSKS